jgi:thioredoxin
MKKVIFGLLLAVLVTISCKSSDGKKSITEGNESSVQSVVTVNNNGVPIHLTKQSFITEIMDYEKNPDKWVYKGELPGLIDFYADWCRPCKITSPILDELAKEYQGKIQIYKVNVDNEQELAALFGVQSIPTFLFMPMTGNPTISSGIAQTPEQTKEMFRQQIENILLGATVQ